MAIPESQAKAPAPTGAGISVLLIEDEQMLQDLYARILRTRLELLAIWRADSLAAAMAVAEAPDVVILDLGLPDSTGLGGLTAVRHRWPGAVVIITTGTDDEALAMEALRSGAQDYLLKGSLDASSLARSVRYAVERAQGETARRRMEERLHASEHLFTHMVDSIADLLAIVDRDGCRRFTNASYRRHLGYSQEELKTLRFKDLIHPEDQVRVKASLDELFEHGGTGQISYRARHKNGEYLYFESSATLLPVESGAEPRVVFVARDITERKRAEQEQARQEVQIRHAQKLESIGQLAAGIAHEINTPAQYIGDNIIFLENAIQDIRRFLLVQKELLVSLKSGAHDAAMLAKAETAWSEADLDFLAAEAPKAVHQCLEGVARVSKIVGAMKDFSHPDGDTKTRTNLNRGIESTTTVCRNEWKYVADLVLDLDPALPAVDCHPGEMNQAILNLVINAAHAIGDIVKEGNAKGRITIRTRQVEDGVQIEVEDTGPGIPDAIRPHIFDPFFTTKPVGKGTGQGLAIVHSVVVEKHGGSIEVQTEPGRGTKFILRLPMGGDAI